MSIKEIIEVDPAKMGGTPVFKGTRVPISVLFDHLEESSLNEFLKGFPSVKREQAESVIEWASDLVQSISKRYESAA
jgi:uncharacterized protein (DUF433 family)